MRASDLPKGIGSWLVGISLAAALLFHVSGVLTFKTHGLAYSLVMIGLAGIIYFGVYVNNAQNYAERYGGYIRKLDRYIAEHEEPKRAGQADREVE